jgi:hypothetical protein
MSVLLPVLFFTAVFTVAMHGLLTIPSPEEQQREVKAYLRAKERERVAETFRRIELAMRQVGDNYYGLIESVRKATWAMENITQAMFKAVK